MSNYNPIPPRAWSRVENPCIFIIPGSTYQQSYISLTGQVVSQSQADYEMKQIYKGNILQYKGNSAKFTKSQRYSQLAKMTGPNRTKVFATQSQTYTNPNTTGLLRVGYSTYPFPNQIPGAPNNISGPFAYGIPNPYDCSGNSIQDGGTLVCGTFANPCSGEIIKKGVNPATICYPASASNVPGPSFLCWNNKVQTWFPRQRYFMNNSTNKWPEGYKGFISAVPTKLILTINSNTCNSVTLSWNSVFNCIPITSYNIYQNGVLIQNVPYTSKTAIIDGILFDTTYSFYITSVSNTGETIQSNIVTVNNPLPFTSTATYSYINDTNCNFVITFTGNGTITFNNIYDINVIAVGGGGGGGGGSHNHDGYTTLTGGGGGGGGGVGILNNFNVTSGVNYSINIGAHGVGGSGNNAGGPGGDSSFKNGTTNYLTAYGGLAGGGYFTSPTGGLGGTATSITSITSYNGGNGGDGYQNEPNPFTPTSGSNTTPAMPIGPIPGGSTYYFSGGGGGGVFVSTYLGGLAGNNGTGGAVGGNSVTNGQSALSSSYGSGGGGGGCPLTNNTPSFGGAGNQGVIIIYFTYI